VPEALGDLLPYASCTVDCNWPLPSPPNGLEPRCLFVSLVCSHARVLVIWEDPGAFPIHQFCSDVTLGIKVTHHTWNQADSRKPLRYASHARRAAAGNSCERSQRSSSAEDIEWKPMLYIIRTSTLRCSPLIAGLAKPCTLGGGGAAAAGGK
jgi:hypothetical protein